MLLDDFDEKFTQPWLNGERIWLADESHTQVADVKAYITAKLKEFGERLKSDCAELPFIEYGRICRFIDRELAELERKDV